MYDLLITKANICEVLTIRLLREYRSHDRINLLFINPLKFHEDCKQLKQRKHLQSFNTLELSILSKSKKFLSQPAVVQILDRVYNGELMMNELCEAISRSLLDFLRSSKLPKTAAASSKFDGDESFCFSRPINENEKCDSNVVNYKFNRITINKVLMRSEIVPKYQSLVINLKYVVVTGLFLALVLKHKTNKEDNNPLNFNSVLSVAFWMVALSFNLDIAVKLSHIEFMFLKKIIWTYVDILIVVLTNISFVVRIIYSIGKIDSSLYYNCFSLISILLIPRMLSIFNNYRFFNMIFVSLRKMLWNVIAIFSLFLSLTFGFFLCFISLTDNLKPYDVAFGMLKTFFGYTPAVWDNWKNYDNLGKAILLMYLFIIQFVASTILAIVLSNVFMEVSKTNNEEFEYLKTTNLIIYLKWSSSQRSSGRRLRLVQAFDLVVTIFKMPIILIIYFYEILIKDNKMLLRKQQRDLKKFTFLSREDDLFGDSDMLALSQAEEGSSLRIVSKADFNLGQCRQTSCEGSGSKAAEYTAGNSRNMDATKPQNNSKLESQPSQATLPGFRSGLMDSAFIDGFLEKKYGISASETNKLNNPKNRIQSSDTTKKSDQTSTQILSKLQELEEMLVQVINLSCDSDQTAIQHLSFLGEYSSEIEEDKSESAEDLDVLTLDLSHSV